MESDQIKGVVVITLPPPNDPSLGKTITAFTLSDDSPESVPQSTAPRQEEQVHNSNNVIPQQYLPIQVYPNQRNLCSFRNLFTGTPRKLVAILGICLLAVYLCPSHVPDTLQELLNVDSNDDDRPKSLLFPLFSKSGHPGEAKDVQLKLGKIMGVSRENLVATVDDGLGSPKLNKLGSYTSKMYSSTILPVHGNVFPDGLYYTYVIVGNPPRSYFLDIDTGSDLTWIQCDAPCTSCGKGSNPLYKPRSENVVSFKDSLCMEVQRDHSGHQCKTCLQCDYEIQYADKSSSMGVLVKDEFNLVIANGSLTNLNVIFGCGYDQQGSILNTLSKTDGILGLSRAKISFPSQLASRGIVNNVVGHCLTSDAAGGGYMFLGDEYVPQWGIAWVPMLNSPFIDFYQTNIVRVNYGSSRLSPGAWGSNQERVVFDSGSSYTYFTKEAYSQLVASLKEVSIYGLIQVSSDPICWKTEFSIRSVKDVKEFFKPLTFQFGSRFWILSKNLEIPPENYLVISKEGNVCLGILDGSQVHDGSIFILGDNSFRGKLIIYDNVNDKIGWTASDCHYPMKLKSLHPLNRRFPENSVIANTT